MKIDLMILFRSSLVSSVHYAALRIIGEPAIDSLNIGITLVLPIVIKYKALQRSVCETIHINNSQFQSAPFNN